MGGVSGAGRAGARDPAGFMARPQQTEPRRMRADNASETPKRIAKTQQDLDALLQEVRACRRCADVLPLGPRPVLRGHATARVLIAGQAPGTRVHATGLPWNDPSGDRLRAWLQLDRDAFYDETRIAIIPAGFCYPGRAPRGGDNPPRPECAEWLPKLLPHFPCIATTILAGAYAQRLYLGNRIKETLTETVRAWGEYAPEFIPMPHPSFRNNFWIRQHPWFEQEVLPYAQERLRRLLRD